MVDAVETMAWVAEKPWHGLGVEVPASITPEALLVKAGLDWQVQKRALYYKIGDSRKVIKDRFGLVRSSDDSLLSLCGPRYQPVQNSQVMDFFQKFVEAGHMKMNTAGSLLDGKFIWALAEVGDSFTLAGSDKVKGYLLMMSPHEAGRAMVIQHTSVRVVCWNTLNAALGAGLRGKAGAFRFGHVRKFDDEAKRQAEEALGLSHEHLKQFKENAERLQGVKVTEEAAVEYFVKVFKVDKDKAKRESPAVKKATLALTHAPGQQLDGTLGTAWGALNAVTYVVDHQLGRSRDKVLRDSWLGYRGETKRRALELALDL